MQHNQEMVIYTWVSKGKGPVFLFIEHSHCVYTKHKPGII